MSEASLNIAFGTTGENLVKAELQAVKRAGVETYSEIAKASATMATVVAEAQRRAAQEQIATLQRQLEAVRAAAQEQEAIHRRIAESARLAEQERLNASLKASAAAASAASASASVVAGAQQRAAADIAASQARAVQATRQAEQEKTAIAIAEQAKRTAAAAQAESIVVAAQKRALAEREAAAKASADREAAQARTAANVLATARSQAAQAMSPTSGGGGGTSLVDWSIYATGLNQAINLTRQLVNVTTDVINEAAKWEAYKVALNDIEGSAYGAKNAMAELYEIAKAPGIGFAEAQKTYIQLRAVNIEGEKAKRIIKDVANTVALSGGTSVEFERVNRQLVQMLANGRVLESDLKWMKEAMPRLATVMQDTFGTTSAEGIRKMGLNAEEFLNGILVGMEKLPTATRTLQSEIENAETAWSMFKASFADTDFWKGTLRGVTSVLETMTEIASTGAKNKERDTYWRKAYLDEDISFAKAGSGQQNKRSDAIIRSMQNSGMTGSLRVEAGPLTGYWASEKAKEDDAERQRMASKKDADAKAEKDRKSGKTKEPLDMAALDRDVQNDIYNSGNARRLAFREKHVGTPERWSDDRMRQDKIETDKYYEEAEADAKRRVDESNAEFERLRAYREAQEAKKEARRQYNEEEAARLDEKYMSDYEKMNNALALEREAILSNTELTQRQRNELLKKYDDESLRQRTAYWSANTSLILTASSDMFGAMSDTAKGALGETSTTYKTLFGISKGFAIADASLKLGQAIMNAYASQPWPANMGAVAGVIGATSGVISSINSAAFSGVFDKGGTIPMGSWGIAGEVGPEIIQGPAHVTSTKATAQILGQSKPPVVNVYNQGSNTVAVKQGPDGSIDLIIQAAVQAAEEAMATGVASGQSKLASVIESVYGVRR